MAAFNSLARPPSEETLRLDIKETVTHGDISYLTQRRVLEILEKRYNTRLEGFKQFIYDTCVIHAREKILNTKLSNHSKNSDPNTSAIHYTNANGGGNDSSSSTTAVAVANGIGDSGSTPKHKNKNDSSAKHSGRKRKSEDLNNAASPPSKKRRLNESIDNSSVAANGNNPTASTGDTTAAPPTGAIASEIISSIAVGDKYIPLQITSVVPTGEGGGTSFADPISLTSSNSHLPRPTPAQPTTVAPTTTPTTEKTTASRAKKPAKSKLEKCLQHELSEHFKSVFGRQTMSWDEIWKMCKTHIADNDLKMETRRFKADDWMQTVFKELHGKTHGSLSTISRLIWKQFIAVAPDELQPQHLQNREPKKATATVTQPLANNNAQPQPSSSNAATTTPATDTATVATAAAVVGTTTTATTSSHKKHHKKSKKEKHSNRSKHNKTSAISTTPSTSQPGDNSSTNSGADSKVGYGWLCKFSDGLSKIIGFNEPLPRSLITYFVSKYVKEHSLEDKETETICCDEKLRKVVKGKTRLTKTELLSEISNHIVLFSDSELETWTSKHPQLAPILRSNAIDVDQLASVFTKSRPS